MFLGAHWRKPMDFSEETLQQAAARADGFREVFRNPSEPAPEGEWDRFVAALDDDFNTPEALAIMHGWRDHDLVRRGARALRARRAAEAQEAPAEVVEPRRRRQQARAEQRLRRGGSSPRRDRVRGLGRPRRRRRLPARPEMTTEQVYGRNAVREALRGPRGVRELWATERALDRRALAAGDERRPRPGEARARADRGDREP